MRQLSFAFAIAVLLVAAVASPHVSPLAPYERQTDSEPRPAERDTDSLGWYAPDFSRLQTGGFVGLFALGTGYAMLNDVLNVSAHYGFTPAEQAGTTVHALSFEVMIRPFDVRIGDLRVVPVYLGPGLLYAWGSEFFTRVPARYRHIDSRYYPPTATHWTARAGLELDYVAARGFFERHGLYYEATLLGAYFGFYRENPKTVDFEDMFASAIGYRAAF